jgi:hypothetical protein
MTVFERLLLFFIQSLHLYEKLCTCMYRMLGRSHVFTFYEDLDWILSQAFNLDGRHIWDQCLVTDSINDDIECFCQAPCLSLLLHQLLFTFPLRAHRAVRSPSMLST